MIRSKQSTALTGLVAIAIAAIGVMETTGRPIQLSLSWNYTDNGGHLDKNSDLDKESDLDKDLSGRLDKESNGRLDKEDGGRLSKNNDLGKDCRLAKDCALDKKGDLGGDFTF